LTGERGVDYNRFKPEQQEVSAVPQPNLQIGQQVVLQRDGVFQLLNVLRERGYRVIGPTLRRSAIVYDELNSGADLPAGWTDTQDGGTYRLQKRKDDALFGYTVGQHSWKNILHPATRRFWRAKRNEEGFELSDEKCEPTKLAFVGVRACDRQAIAVQDKVFLEGQYVDPIYKSQREDVFIVAVNCGQASGTCFCVSMGTGPKATFGFDLALTEVLENGAHYFVVEIGTARGAEILGSVPCNEASSEQSAAAKQVVTETAAHMGRRMDTTDIKELLYRNYEHPRWDNVAARCLNCTNCTMVCPTCFCTTVEDVTDLTGDSAERWRKWDSCFVMDFSYIVGGSIRASAMARYRQWMTHKLATWIDQFGTSGCVGCGRCITWCPVAIDITEEVRAIRESEPAKKGAQ
jgi:ferredoxin